MLPSSMARQLAGTMGEQLVHLKQDLGRWRAWGGLSGTGRGGFHASTTLKARIAALGLPADVKSPKAVVAVLNACPQIEGLFSSEIAKRAAVSFSMVKVALNALREIGWVTSEMSRHPCGCKALKWTLVRHGDRH